ncbi:MAG: hypothetical protein RR724_09135 [Hydrogenoanaerobacterium sp.]
MESEINKTANDTQKYKGNELIRAAQGTNKDILRVVLKPHELYTETQAIKLLNKFLSKEVNDNAGR